MSILNVNQLQPVGGGNTITVGGSNIDYSGSITGNISVDGNLTVTGVVSQEDITNVDSVGIITARSDVSIADKIIHTGDTDTAIRFPAADTFTIETGGTERLRITSGGLFKVNSTDGGSYHTIRLNTTTNNAIKDVLHVHSSVDSATAAAGYGVRLNFSGEQSNGNEYTFGGIAGLLSSEGANYGDLAFYTNNNGTNSERLRITSGGFVNIGGNFTQTDYTAQVTRIGGNTDTMQIKGNTQNAFIRFTDNDASSDYTLGADDAPGSDDNNFIVYDRNASAYRLVLRSDGNFGIGANNPTEKLEVNGGLKVYQSTNVATFKNNQLRSDAAGTYYFDHGTTGQSFTFRTSTSSSLDTTGPSITSAGNISFPSGKGIDFSATGDASGMASELLDDYEEGTFTPGFGVSTGTVSYSNQWGKYTKVGNVVYIWFRMVATNSANAALYYFTNLPFTISGINGQYPGPCISNFYDLNIGSNGTVLGGYWRHGETRLRFHTNGNSTGQMTPTLVANNSFEIRGEGFYPVS